jgi:hypothetical protein
MTKLKEGRYELRKQTPEQQAEVLRIVGQMRYDCEQQKKQDDKDRNLAEQIAYQLRIQDYLAN